MSFSVEHTFRNLPSFVYGESQSSNWIERQDSRWCIKICRTGNAKKPNGSIRLVFEGRVAASVTCNVTIKISEFIVKPMIQKQFKKSFYRSTEEEMHSGRDVFTNDMLHITCRLEPLSAMVGFVTLQESNLNFYRDKTLTDFDLVVDNATISVHKLVLAGHSPYFKAMFASPMEESVSNQTTVSGFSLEEVKCFIDAVYTESIPDDLSLELKLNVYKLADMYKTQSVLCYAAMSIDKHLSIENCLSVLLFADALASEELKDRALQFIKPNIKEIVKTHKGGKLEELGGPLLVLVLESVIQF